jgi:thiol-disulfide isomerase/thioredoxin
MKYTKLIIIISLFVGIIMIVSCQKNIEKVSTTISKSEDATVSSQNKPLMEKPISEKPTTAEKPVKSPVESSEKSPVEENALSKAPLFNGINLVDGKEFSLDSMKDYILIIDFWAPWCPPCRAEIPGFIELQNKYKDKKFAVVGIAVSTTEADVKKFITDQKVNYPMIMGTDKMRIDYETAIGKKIQTIPTTLIINRKGEIVTVHDRAENMSLFEKEIQGLL